MEAGGTALSDDGDKILDFQRRFHALNMDSSSKGQLARLVIQEPSVSKDDFLLSMQPQCASPRARQSSNMNGSLGEPDCSAIERRVPSSNNDFSLEEPILPNILSSDWAAVDHADPCTIRTREDQHEADLQRSRTRNRRPHMKEVSEKLDRYEKALRKARSDAKEAWQLHAEVDTAIEVTKGKVKDQISLVDRDLGSEVSATYSLVK